MTANPGEQRIGHVVERQPHGSGLDNKMGTYFIRTDNGEVYTFSYVDIVTEGFRTTRVGERVRFVTDPDHPDHANYVIRLDLPDIEEYYR